MRSTSGSRASRRSRLRIGFVGELGYELHFPSPLGEHVWDTLLEQGSDLEAAPFGLEPQRILRLEKGHVIVSQDTDSESNLLEAAMPWIVKNDKEFEWVGKWATQQVADRGLNWMLVGFVSPSGAIPVEGGQVVVGGVSAGRVTSVRHSRELGQVIGLAIVPHELAVDGGRFDVQVDGASRPDARAPRRLLRSSGREAEGVSVVQARPVSDTGGIAVRDVRCRISVLCAGISSRLWPTWLQAAWARFADRCQTPILSRAQACQVCASRSTGSRRMAV